MANIFTLSADVRPLPLREYARETQWVSGVYAIRCKENGRLYVGSSVDIGDRFRKGHCYQLRNGRHPNPLLQEDFVAYGEAAFEAFTLERGVAGEDLLAHEVEHARRLGADYNLIHPIDEEEYGRVNREDFDAQVCRGGPDECWLWTGRRRGEYGRIVVGGKGFLAHRVAYYLATGTSPTKIIRHVCNNKLCVNPDHLVPGTAAENSADLRAANPSACRMTREQADHVRRLWLTGLSRAAVIEACEAAYGRQWPEGYIEAVIRNRILRAPDYRPPNRRNRLTDDHKQWVRRRRADGGGTYADIAQEFFRRFGVSVHKDTVLRICTGRY